MDLETLRRQGPRQVEHDLLGPANWRRRDDVCDFHVNPTPGSGLRSELFLLSKSGAFDNSPMTSGPDRPYR